MPVDPADIYAGYQKATRVAPVDKATITTALSPYKITIPSLRGQSDQQLRRTAALAVLARFRAARKTP